MVISYGMASLLIIGAGGHGKVVADTANNTGIWDEIVFLDDHEYLKEVAKFPVVGRLENYLQLLDKYQYAFVAIGNNKLRLEWIEKLSSAGYIIPTIIHPNSMVSKLSSVGEGTAIMAGVIINAGVTIGQGCILNTHCSVDHDCVIGDGVHISPGVNIAGNVTIDLCTWVCIGSCIGNNVTIGSNVVIAGGSMVIKDIPDNVMVAGTPAIIKKYLRP